MVVWVRIRPNMVVALKAKTKLEISFVSRGIGNERMKSEGIGRKGRKKNAYSSPGKIGGSSSPSIALMFDKRVCSQHIRMFPGPE
jgi:hypothetical protein